MSNVTAHLFIDFHIGRDLFYPSGTLGLAFFLFTIHLYMYSGEQVKINTKLGTLPVVHHNPMLNKATY